MTHRWQIVVNYATSSAGVVVTSGKFATNVNDTGGKFAISFNFFI